MILDKHLTLHLAVQSRRGLLWGPMPSANRTFSLQNVGPDDRPVLRVKKQQPQPSFNHLINTFE